VRWLLLGGLGLIWGFSGPTPAWAIPAVFFKGQVEALEFTSDHNLICRNTTNILKGGKRYPDVEWQRTPPTNAPITHTAGRTSLIKAKITLAVVGIKPNASYVLKGVSEEPALCFTKQGEWPATSEVVLEIEAAKPLGRTIRKIEKPIQWTLTVSPEEEVTRSLDLGITGPHVVYTTLGTPKNTHDPVHAVTDIRMELTVKRVATAMKQVGYSASAPRIVRELMRQNGIHYLPTRDYYDVNAWKLPETWRMEPKGGSCISIVDFVILLCQMTGLEGTPMRKVYCARPEAPWMAIEGSLGNPPIVRQFGFFRGMDNWQLLLVDMRNNRRGAVGGVGGVNYYEAALVYQWNGATYYYPGGLDFVWDSPHKVLHVFDTLAWTRWDPFRQDWVVMQVVYSYLRYGQDRPASVELP
jgi:hypothetical protein